MVFLHLIFVICIAFLSFERPAVAGVFKCRTADGGTVYSSQKCPESNKAVEFKATTLNFFSRPSNKDHNATTSDQPRVEIFITSWCPYCKKAIAYLRSKKIAFTISDIERDRLAKRRKEQYAPGYSGVPLTVIKDTVIKGFSARRFDRALAE